MIEALRLAVSTAAGGFAGWFGYFVLIAFVDFGVRCSGSFDAEEHLAYTVTGAVCGSLCELVRRWNENRKPPVSPDGPKE
jgi:hypothetical protein